MGLKKIGVKISTTNIDKREKAKRNVTRNFRYVKIRINTSALRTRGKKERRLKRQNRVLKEPNDIFTADEFDELMKSLSHEKSFTKVRL